VSEELNGSSDVQGEEREALEKQVKDMFATAPEYTNSKKLFYELRMYKINGDNTISSEKYDLKTMLGETDPLLKLKKENLVISMYPLEQNQDPASPSVEVNPVPFDLFFNNNNQLSI
jgi:hypothetical protein